MTLAFRAAVAATLAAATLLSTAVVHRPHTAVFAKRGSRTDVGAAMRATLATELDSIDLHLTLLGTSTDVASRRAEFRAARHHYKLIEGLAAYYSPPLVAALNSSDAERPDEDQAAGFRVPRGFQRIEPWLFPAVNDTAWHGAPREIESMHTAIAHFRPTIPFIETTDDNALEIVRLELARVSTLGIAGFDVDESGDAIVESADAIDGLRILTTQSALVAALTNVAAYASHHADFDTFDRFTFVRSYVNPAFDSIAHARLSFTAPPLNRTWPRETASVYNARGFDVRSYAPPEAAPASDSLIALGRELFFEPALSGTKTRSCASCHVPERAFTDGHRIAASLDAKGPRATRNTPSLINAGMQPTQFLDGRRGTLEEQIDAVLASPAEMRSSTDIAAAHVSAMPQYRARVKCARDLRAALATYVRSLAAYNAPFDRALRGDTSQFGASERNGFNVFMGKARCGTCHYAPLFNGVAPPQFVSADAEVIGAPRERPQAGAHALLDSDLGRGSIDRRPGLAHAFKTPSLRNVALTAPYMHNGVYQTLEEVVDFYEHGGGAGAGASVPNQTLSSSPLHLTPGDRRDLIAFLTALTDTAGTTARPVRPSSLSLSLAPR